MAEPSSRDIPARKPNATLRWVLMLAACALIFGGVFFVKSFSGKQMNAFFDNMPQPAVAITSAVAKNERWADDAEAVGTFTAVNGTDVTTEAGGVIREILFEPGQRVKAGTVLVRLNTDSELASLRALEASAKLAVAQRDRWRELGTQKLVSQADVEERAADAARAIAQVEAQRALIAQKTVRAPFDGVLGIRKVTLGQYVQPGDAIVNLQALDPILMDFTLPQQRAGQVVEGMEVTAMVDAMDGQAFTGKVIAVEPRIDAQTRNFTVQASFANAGNAIRPGAFAKVRFNVGDARQVVVVPQTAVSFNPYGNSVYVITEEPRKEGEVDMMGKPLTGKKLVVTQRFIKTGATRGDLVAVTEGLKPGERVVTSGLLKLRNGAEVTINNAVQPTSEAAPTPGNS